MAVFVRFFLLALVSFTLLLPQALAQDVNGLIQLLNQGNSEEVVENVEEVRPEEPMPLQLIIEPAKTEFALGEKVEFSLVLLNRGDLSLKVRDISETTTYCLFNGARWGTMEPSGPDNKILAPGESLRKTMRFQSIKSGALDIYCSYGMGFKGIRPSAQSSVIIIK